jgi:predicted 2-oxoglutarate/Fe(II)-dependent dioxygenase YbiX
MQSLSIGDRAPSVIGTGAGGRFFAEDVQIGRPALLIALGVLGPEAAGALAPALAEARKALEHEVDVVVLTPSLSAYAAAFSGTGEGLAVQVTHGEALAQLAMDGAPAVIVVDRAWRIVEIAPYAGETALIALYARLKPRLTSEPPQILRAPAPVLVIPNVIAPETCRALMTFFDQNPHRPGMMASMAGGAATARYDEGKKHRRDIELQPGEALHGEVLKVLAQRCAPEIKRAFQFDVAFADRILIARYDEEGGYFKRHRDNLAPQVAFRDFAVSMNLNTGEYEGGELIFPEFSDHLHNPPAGSAAVFSASLLHEAAPVRRGRRYVALSFLSGAASQAKMTHAA